MPARCWLAAGSLPAGAGSLIEGEDIVQDTLAKAFYARPMMPEVPLRPWLFRIAHNTAGDALERHGGALLPRG